jgi:hypothetical protein
MGVNVSDEKNLIKVEAGRKGGMTAARNRRLKAGATRVEQVKAERLRAELMITEGQAILDFLDEYESRSTS